MSNAAQAYARTSHTTSSPREIEAQGTPFLHHLAHLTVHGFLHLVGYDHETDSQAESMEGLERDILATLAVPDPYRVPETGNA